MSLSIQTEAESGRVKASSADLEVPDEGRSVEGSTDCSPKAFGSPIASGWGNFSPMADGPEGSTATSTSEEGLEDLMVEETEAASHL